MNWKTHNIKIKSYTRAVDKFNLFDFESEDLEEGNMELIGNGYIGRDKTGTLLNFGAKKDLTEGSELMMRVRTIESGFVLEYPKQYEEE